MQNLVFTVTDYTTQASANRFSYHTELTGNRLTRTMEEEYLSKTQHDVERMAGCDVKS